MNKSTILLFSILFISSIFFVASQTNVVNLKDWVKVEIVSPLEDNGGLSVNVQDQTTRTIDIRLHKIIPVTYSLSVSPIQNSYNIILNTTTGLTVGDNFAVLEQNGMPQLLFGEILEINANTVTLDTPLPYNYTPNLARAFEFNKSLAVNGATTTEVFAIINQFDEAIDITRFIFHCTDNVVMDDEKFCGITKLTRGVVLRKKLLDGNYINYWNVKSNGEWGELAYDKSYDDKAPAGFYGFTTRLTYGGQSKHGVVIRLEPEESIEFLVQDDLTGLETGSIMAEGHFVQN